MNGSHECPGPRCGKQIRDDMLACSRHWYQVSAKTRRRVWAAWRNGEGAGTDEHTAAIYQAVQEMTP
jgi:hypothetical protein